MKISFIIPSYNEEKHIGQCLDSITRETSKYNHKTEIIVVNNASTDNTARIASSFSGVRVVDEPHKGVIYARQKGFELSSGDFIVNFDADSIMPDGWLAIAMEEFDKCPNLVALSGPVVYYDLPAKLNRLVRWYYYIGCVSSALNRFFFKSGPMLQLGGVMIKRTALEQIGGYNALFEFYGDDTDLACRLYKIGKVKFKFKLAFYSSGRRILREGAWTMAMRYGLNYFHATFFSKPFTKDHIDVRLHQKD